MVILGQNTILTSLQLESQVDQNQVFNIYIQKYLCNVSKYVSVYDFFFNSGNLVSLRGNMYYFHGYSTDTYKMLPVHQIFENGTSLELPYDPPFEKELSLDHNLLAMVHIKTALYHRRFYTKKN